MRWSIIGLLMAGAAANPISQDARAVASVEASDANVAPSLQALPARYGDYAPGAKRAKVRYGPYVLPSIKDQTALSAISGEQGTMMGLSVSTQKPCSGDCSLLTAQAGLEYADGRAANMSTGAWLHHIVLVVKGAGRQDTTCGIMPSERIFSAGIEQNQLNFSDVTHGRIKSALPVAAADRFHLQYELMNMVDAAQAVYVTIDFEFLPGALPRGWATSKLLWLDITGCPGISSALPPPGKQQFTLSMRPWTAPWNARVIDIGGHLHDGGTRVRVLQNDRSVCESTASYSAQPADMAAMAGSSRSTRHGPSSNDAQHISGMTVCDKPGAVVKKGDRLAVDATYDFDRFAGMKSTAGAYTEIMGIALMVVAIDP